MLKILRKLRNFFVKTKNFGIITAFQISIVSYFKYFLPEAVVAQKRDVIVKKYLNKKYAGIIGEFIEKCPSNNHITTPNPYPVWVCWWQGEENMPQTVRICYKYLLNYANGNPITLITMENYQSYVNIPDYIIKKVEKGTISLTHFSDILRVCLLYEHGGLWLDSTVLLTSPLAKMTCDFFSLKCKNDIFENISKKRWHIVVLYSPSHNIIFEFVRKAIFEYFKFHDLDIDYYLLDYTIDIGYDAIPTIKKLIDNVPPNDGITNFIAYNYNEKFDIAVFNKLCKSTYFHKLNHKSNYHEYTKNGELTYYGYILQLGESITNKI